MRIIKFYLKTTWKFTALFLCLTFCSCQLEKKNNESKALEVFYSANKQSEDVKKFEFIFEQISDLQKDNSIVGAEVLTNVAQDKIDNFLKNQPIIDVHIHITKGYADNEDYNKINSDIDIAKIEWMGQRFDQNNIVLALGGGPIKYAKLWQQLDKRHWSGPRFPCNLHKIQDEPCDSEMPELKELEELFKNKTFRSLGETSFHSMGILPTEERFDNYWKLAEKYQIPIGFHADAGPFKRDMDQTPNWNEAYGNPLLLLPILKKYPKLKIYLMHYPGRYFNECIEVMKQYDQIYCEITAVSMFAPKERWEPRVKKLFEEGLGDRLMFGSDYVGTIRKNIEIIYNLDWLSDNQKRDIYYNNAAKFLNLTDLEIKTHHKMVD